MTVRSRQAEHGRALSRLRASGAADYRSAQRAVVGKNVGADPGGGSAPEGFRARGDGSVEPTRGARWGDIELNPRFVLYGHCESSHVICPAVLGDMCHHSHRWTSASSTL